MRIHSLEHAPQEGAGKITGWARTRGHPLKTTRLDLGEPLPQLPQFDLLVVMGGAMNIYQYRDYPWLRVERELIGSAASAGKGVLGICLGAQLLADALGARVYQNTEKEIGWHPIRVIDRSPPFHEFPAECTVFHWHGDTFDLPTKCRRVAESDACANQAFVFGDRLIGIQFHAEVSREALEGFMEGADSELAPARWVQSARQIREATPDMASIDKALWALLDSLATTLTSHGPSNAAP